MEIPESLCCLFSAQVEYRNGTYVIEIPDQELQHGALEQDETYRVGILSTAAERDDDTGAPEPAHPTASDQPPVEPTQSTASDQPPVEPGDTRLVEIESLGDQGDGIARVDRGFVIIVPDTEPSERVRIEVTDVRESVGFAEVVERLDYYE
jgi:predicted RNA-binding protein with TRAM domain